jgi:DNA polymerase
MKIMLPTFADHAARWGACNRCELAAQRTSVVLARGTVPADVLIVGEAPGDSEDMLGMPFVGAAGHLLDGILTSAGFGRVRWVMTNLVACYPRDAKQAAKRGDRENSEPPDAAIKACGPRLQEFARIADGRRGRLRLVVAVGTLARDWLDEKRRGHVTLHRPIRRIDIRHPAGILRAQTEALKSQMTMRATVTLANALEEVGLR